VGVWRPSSIDDEEAETGEGGGGGVVGGGEGVTSCVSAVCILEPFLVQS
jgi:hypothetical protein